MKAKHFLACGLVAALAALSGCAQSGSRQERSTVTVGGVGTVYVKPDMVQLTVSLSRVAGTTRAAQESVARMAGRALAVLKDSGIEDKDVMTASLRFNPEYEWRNNRSVLVGQRAEQSIDFAVRDIGQDAEKVARIIDRLVEIDGIALDRIDFGIADNTEHFVRSRELAFEKAMQKARQYAELSGMKVVGVSSLSEEGSDSASPLYRTSAANQFKLEMAVSADEASTALPSGQMEITSRIAVTFLLE